MAPSELEPNQYSPVAHLNLIDFFVENFEPVLLLSADLLAYYFLLLLHLLVLLYFEYLAHLHLLLLEFVEQLVYFLYLRVLRIQGVQVVLELVGLLLQASHAYGSVLVEDTVCVVDVAAPEVNGLCPFDDPEPAGRAH